MCEVLYNASIEDTHSFSDDQKVDIEASLNKLEHILSEQLFSRSEVLFLPIGPKEWTSFEPIYIKEKSRDDVDIVVIPLPLMLKNIYGQIIAKVEDIPLLSHVSDYPSDVPLTDLSDYDISVHCPERIYIQNPYDSQHPILTVPTHFYSQSLVSYTDELIYMPIGYTSEFGKDDIPDQINLKFYVTAPGLMYADKILVQSENIREQYIDALTVFAGETTRNIWNKKICVECQDKTNEISSDNTCASRKKNLLYCIASYEYYEHPENFQGAFESRIKILTEATDRISFEVCAYPPSADFVGVLSETADAYGISFLSYDINKISELVANYDAYYGSSSPFVHEFILRNKPVMISN